MKKGETKSESTTIRRICLDKEKGTGKITFSDGGIIQISSISGKTIYLSAKNTGKTSVDIIKVAVSVVFDVFGTERAEILGYNITFKKE